MPRRRRDAVQTRADLLAAARGQFARRGFDRVTVRSVAAEVGVDQSLVLRYFGSKAELFTEAARVDFALPDLTGRDPEEIADALVERFFALFEEQDTFLALLRTAATNEIASRQLLSVFLDQAAPALAAVALDRPAERSALVGSQVLGFAFVRYALGAPALRAMTREEVRAWIGPTLIRYLTDPDLGIVRPPSKSAVVDRVSTGPPDSQSASADM